ncbi:MAG: uracil-DNA glycosylase [Bacteroidetes bacterium]|nr:uracil-DNA glycosylase [Bacteroidota bacterium]
MKISIEESWKTVLKEEFDKPYFEEIVHFLRQEKQLGKVIYPKGPDIFRAFELTPFSKVRVLLLGQDPYHGPNQAHGLCFSVNPGVKIPPSLANIYKELHSDIGLPIPNNGDLSHWAQQGILMLNASLTVEAAKPMSHAHIGWETFTDAVIKKVSDEKRGVVFVLWGKFAQQKEGLIDTHKHTVLKAAHPSPFSAYNGFLGCRHFSKLNSLLDEPIRF